MSRILWVTGFPNSMRARDLGQEFERYGPLVRCDIPIARGDRPRFAFVEFEDDRDARDAKREMDHMQLDGCDLQVAFARSGLRNPSPPRGYDRRGAGGRRGGYEERRGYDDRRGGFEDRRGGYDEDRRGGYDDRRGSHDDRRGGYDDRRYDGGDDRRDSRTEKYSRRRSYSRSPSRSPRRSVSRSPSRSPLARESRRRSPTPPRGCDRRASRSMSPPARAEQISAKESAAVRQAAMPVEE